MFTFFVKNCCLAAKFLNDVSSLKIWKISWLNHFSFLLQGKSLNENWLKLFSKKRGIISKREKDFYDFFISNKYFCGCYYCNRKHWNFSPIWVKDYFFRSLTLLVPVNFKAFETNEKKNTIKTAFPFSLFFFPFFCQKYKKNKP